VGGLLPLYSALIVTSRANGIKSPILESKYSQLTLLPVVSISSLSAGQEKM
jgi:hypothetical protein